MKTKNVMLGATAVCCMLAVGFISLQSAEKTEEAIAVTGGEIVASTVSVGLQVDGDYDLPIEGPLDLGGSVSTILGSSCLDLNGDGVNDISYGDFDIDIADDVEENDCSCRSWHEIPGGIIGNYTPYLIVNGVPMVNSPTIYNQYCPDGVFYVARDNQLGLLGNCGPEVDAFGFGPESTTSIDGLETIVYFADMENGCSDAVCGNGIVEEGEECDGSDPKNGIYCSDTCELEVIIEPQDPTDGGTIIKDDTTIKGNTDMNVPVKGMSDGPVRGTTESLVPTRYKR